MEIVISDTNIFIDLWNIGLLERFCELPLSIHTTDFIIGELKTQGVKDAIAQLHQEGKITIKTFKSNEYAEIMSLQDKNLSFQDCTVLYYALNGDYKLLTVYHHYSVPTILQVVTRICFRKKLFYYRF